MSGETKVVRVLKDTGSQISLVKSSISERMHSEKVPPVTFVGVGSEGLVDRVLVQMSRQERRNGKVYRCLSSLRDWKGKNLMF